MTSDGDVPPILFESAALRRVLLRALNRNQLLILSQIKSSRSQTLTSLLQSVSASHAVPLSTLKLNARVLCDLALIDFEEKGEIRTPRLTDDGNAILGIVSGGGEN